MFENQDYDGRWPIYIFLLQPHYPEHQREPVLILALPGAISICLATRTEERSPVSCCIAAETLIDLKTAKNGGCLGTVMLGNAECFC